MTLDQLAATAKEDLLALNQVEAKVLPARGKMRVPVQVFASPRLPPGLEETRRLEQIASLDGVSKVVGLPDLHLKPRLEAPSSLAVATRDQVVLSLSSPSPGCGMALVNTGLQLHDLSSQRLDAFFISLSTRLPIDKAAYGISTLEMQAILRNGSAEVARLFELDPDGLSHIEQGGNALASLRPTVEPGEILESIPSELIGLAVQEFGQIGRGNHFLEVQVVDEVLDGEIALHWGVAAGQVLVMYHADSGKLGALAGRLYAYRQKNTPRGRWLEMRMKTRFHLGQASGLADLARRAGFFFSPRRFVPIPVGSRAARQALVALGAAANYAYANRLAVFAVLKASLEQVWGHTARMAGLLVDISHNSIREEMVAGEERWVHRHNACQALPPGHKDLLGGPFALSGQPVLLPGTHRHSSYLCAARQGVVFSLFSVPHGAGTTAERLDSEGDRSGQSTRVYNLQGGLQAVTPHGSDQGVREVLSVLEQSELVKPVARLRPVAVMKDSAR